MNIFSRDKHIAVIAELCGGLGVPVAPDTNARYVSRRASFKSCESRMARKQSVDSSAEEERARRLTAILQGALSGALPPPKDSPKNNGEALAVPDRPITTAANQVHAAAEALRNVANGQGSAHEAPPPPKKHSKRDKKP